MKKIICLFLTFVLVIASLSSCKPAEKKKEGYKIAFVPKLTSASWFQRMESGVKEYNKEKGTDYFYGGSTDAAGQAIYLEQLLAEDWDAICIVPYDTESIAPLLEKARKEGVTIITHEADTLGSQVIDYDIEAFKSEDLGRHFGEVIVNETGGEGTYIQYVGSLNSVTHATWCDNADKYIQENSNLRKLGRYETNDDAVIAYNQTKELLQAHPEITAIQGSSSTDLPGIARAVSELGLNGKITVVGASLPSICSEYVKDGTITAFSLWDPALSAKVMLDLAENVLKNKDSFDLKSYRSSIAGYEELYVNGIIIYGNARIDITKDNIADYDF